jgi:hypothetical protein
MACAQSSELEVNAIQITWRTPFSGEYHVEGKTTCNRYETSSFPEKKHVYSTLSISLSIVVLDVLCKFVQLCLVDVL